MKEEIANVSAGVPGTGVTPEGKPQGFGDAIVNPKAAKTWKKINAMLRRRSPVMEQEQIDELHQDTIWDYSDKALTSLDKSRKVGYKKDFSPKPGKKAAAARKTFDKRDRGLAMASKRLGGVFDEETQIDELSRKTLSNYIKKASDNRAKNQGEFDFYYKKKNSKKYGKAFRNVMNRRKGIRTATDKLVKESATMAALAAGSALGAAAAPHINKAVGKGLNWLEKKRKQKHQDHYDKKSRRIVKEETFAGAAIFEVSSKLFHNITLQKRKGKHWRTYLEEDDCYAEIREWARKHPKGKIVVRNECTGEMRYVRY